MHAFCISDLAKAAYCHEIDLEQLPPIIDMIDPLEGKGGFLENLRYLKGISCFSEGVLYVLTVVPRIFYIFVRQRDLVRFSYQKIACVRRIRPRLVIYNIVVRLGGDCCVSTMRRPEPDFHQATNLAAVMPLAC